MENEIDKIEIGKTRELLEKDGLEQEWFAIMAKAIIDETKKGTWDMSYIQEKLNSMQKFRDRIVELYKKEGGIL
jgi:predicted molibdopterin-dependent oxidoreductase YjgC